MALVILTHHYSQGPRLIEGTVWFLEAVPLTAKAGVSLFFVIGGFLITTLILNERVQFGQVSLRLFYMRRALRILPPFYCYLAVAAWLQGPDWTQVTRNSFVAAALFFYNYSSSRTMILAHTWSLAVEEQFYLVWPAIASRTSRSLAIGFCLLGIFVWPALRWIRHGSFCDPDPFVALETTAMDTIMFGSLLAYYWRHPRLRDALWISSSLGGLLALLGLLIIYRFYSLVPPAFTILLPLTRNCLLTYLLWWCVENPGHLVGRILESKPIAHIGVLSYSLYLWQQPFYVVNHWTCRFPAGIIGALIVAHVSFYLIEQPASNLRIYFRRGASP